MLASHRMSPCAPSEATSFPSDAGMDSRLRGVFNIRMAGHDGQKRIVGASA
jgi:hypothetical protein